MAYEDLTLRQILQQEFERVLSELKVLGDVMQKLSDLSIISPQEIDLLKLQVGGLSESLHDLEIRVNALEKHSGIATEVSRQAFTVFLLVLVLIAWGVWS